MMKVIKVLSVLILGIILAGPVFAQDWAGKVTELEGQVKIIRAGVESVARTGSAILAGDEIITGANSRVRIWFKDESVITLAPNSRFRVDALEYQPGTRRKSIFTLVTGKARAMVSGWFSKTPEQDYQIKALSTVAGVRGTEFVIEIRGSGADMSALFAGLSGTLTIWDKDHPDKKVSVPANYFLEVLNGAIPGSPQPLTQELLMGILEGLGFSFGSRPDREDMILQIVFIPDHHGGEEGGPIEFVLVIPSSEENDPFNPSNLIFQEPPGFTAVNIIVNEKDFVAK